MGKYLLSLPDDVHDELRHLSVDTKQDIRDLILNAINVALKKKVKKNGHKKIQNSI